MSAFASLQRMATLQEGYNLKVSETWSTDGLEFYRAIWVECAELLEHYGWKWWKHQEPDLAQARLEVIDIWHFGLSQLLIENRIDATLAEMLSAPPTAGVDFHRAVEDMAQDTLATHSFDPVRFKALMDALDMSWEQLVGEYVGKNVLNHFRRAHGYADGTYIKSWGGMEDNEHLVELVGTLDVDASDFPDRVMAGLESRYAEHNAR